VESYRELDNFEKLVSHVEQILLDRGESH